MISVQNRFRQLSAIVDGINLLAQFICYRLLELIVIVTVMQVVLRFVFNSPTKWSEEVAMICLVWFGMIAVAIGVRRHSHISIMFLRDRLPDKGRMLLDAIAQIAILAFSVVLISKGWDLVGIAGKTRLPASQIPKSLLYFSAMTGGGLMCLNAIANLVVGPLSAPDPEPAALPEQQAAPHE